MFQILMVGPCWILIILMLLMSSCEHSGRSTHLDKRHQQYESFNYLDDVIQARRREQRSFGGEESMQQVLQIYSPATMRIASFLKNCEESPLDRFEEGFIFRTTTSHRGHRLVLTAFLDSPAEIAVKYPGPSYMFDEDSHKKWITWVPLSPSQVAEFKKLIQSSKPSQWVIESRSIGPGSSSFSLEYKFGEQIFFTQDCNTTSSDSTILAAGRFLFLAANLEACLPDSSPRWGLGLVWGIQ